MLTIKSFYYRSFTSYVIIYIFFMSNLSCFGDGNADDNFNDGCCLSKGGFENILNGV